VTFKSSAVKLYVEFECQNVFDVQERARGPLSCSRGGGSENVEFLFVGRCTCLPVCLSAVSVRHAVVL